MASPVTADVLDSPALPLLLALEARAVRVELTADGRRLIVEPVSRLTSDEQAAVRAYARELATLIRECDNGVQDRRDVFAQQLAQTPAPGVPAFAFKTGIVYVPGVCFSCGDGLPELHFGRCSRCSIAWRLACSLPVLVEFADAIDAARRIA